MASSGRPSVNKRNREQARRERNQEKAARRDQRATEQKGRPQGDGGEDPDIAGIVPGPQPPIGED
ncbi:MAG: hypothetical protein EXR72_15890 [Myxococcales bacterium]|nr:hypothetical protein [Myxococcales bacterium]